MADDTETLVAIIRANLTDDLGQTRQAVEDDLRLTARQKQLLGPVLHDEVRRIYRYNVREIEPRSDDGTEVDPTSTRAYYLRGRFKGADGKWVTWGEATIEDHQARIDFLERLRSGLTKTIEAHEHAIADLLAADGVTCLNDLPAVAAGDTPEAAA